MRLFKLGLSSAHPFDAKGAKIVAQRAKKVLYAKKCT
jgi:hypothetical protein